jgi:hypothetical protein
VLGSRGDEINIDFLGGPIIGNPIGLVKDISIWSCQSPACQTAYGFSGFDGTWAQHILPTSQNITYTKVPEAPTLVLLGMGGLMLAFWRRP